jgi:hypothetical protein
MAWILKSEKKEEARKGERIIKYVGKSIIIRNVVINFISVQIENLH